MVIQNKSFTRDPHSFANPAEAVVQHLELDLTVDFENRIIWGSANYAIAAAADAQEIIFDTRDLVIEAVTVDALPEPFLLGEEKPFLGRPLRVAVTAHTKNIKIFYRTASTAAALQWLNPAQTAGKQHPFLFTQSQAVLARTWLPCQDSPAIRFTYEAFIRVPASFLALMSAENPTAKNDTGQYHFHMRQPIPSYLMALAVGDLALKPFDARTGIYAEPVMLEAAYQEFRQLPHMLEAAETLYGPYLWERYDLLLLPPSFPFGGMENPRLTFVTPTILAGDRSLTSLVAHELAHSWSGNLVTNATWNDFWLNEGFTVYFERRIMEAIAGAPYADMLKVLGYQDLLRTLQEIGPDSADTHLKLDLQNRDPDEGLTEIAYEKGNYLLLALEARYGRPVFDAFIRQYFQTFAFQSMDTETFLNYLQENLLQPNRGAQEEPQPESWIYQPGLPEKRPVLSSPIFDRVKTQAGQWAREKNPQILETANWTTHEWLYFLHLLAPTLEASDMAQLDAAYHLSQSGNAEILAVWLEQAIRLGYTPADPALESFLQQVGRRKFLLPLYKALRQRNPERARAIYSKARANYHAVATSSLDNLLTGNREE
jgi:leukotriene-A4 hydrolase